MGRSLIPLIAKELGVEIGEEFKLTNYDSKWRFAENNLQFFNTFGPEEDHEWLNALDVTLKRVIIGELKIIKPPFRPKRGERYWTYKDTDFSIATDIWNGFVSDYMNKNCGCVFRTKEEAFAARPEKFKELTGRDWEE